MDKVNLEIGMGSDIGTALKKATDITSLIGDNVSFDFNGYIYESSLDPYFCNGVKEVNNSGEAWQYVAVQNNYMTFFVSQNGVKVSLRKKTAEELAS